jgi:FkbM family methyltransferase
MPQPWRRRALGPGEGDTLNLSEQFRRQLSRIRDHLVAHALRVWLRPKSSTHLTRLGSAYGGWWVPSPAVRPQGVAYCAGAGEDISFDLALHDAGMRVVTYDPTPRAIEYVRRVGPKSERFHFMPIGWWDAETDLRFFAPRDPEHVSHSAVNLQKTAEYFQAKVMPPANLARILGHDVIDIVKMDIEGAEGRVLNHMIEHGPLPVALLIEFDQPQDLVGTVRMVRKLRSKGYRLEHVERFNMSFLRADSA